MAAAGEVATPGAAVGASAGQLAAHSAGGRQRQGRGRQRREGSQQQARWAGAAGATDNGGGYRVSGGPRWRAPAVAADGGWGDGGGAGGRLRRRGRGQGGWRLRTAAGERGTAADVGGGVGGDGLGAGGADDDRQPRARRQPGGARTMGAGAAGTAEAAVGGVGAAAVGVGGCLVRCRRRLGRPWTRPQATATAVQCGGGGGERAPAPAMLAARARVAAGAAAYQPEEGLTRGRLTRPRLMCPLIISDPPFLPVSVGTRRVSDVPERAFGHEPPHHVYVTHSNDRGHGAERARGRPGPRGTIFHPWVAVETKI